MTQKPTFTISSFEKMENPLERPLERLSSLSSSRDLSLGGTKPKKAFVPNLKLTRKCKAGPKEHSDMPSSSKPSRRVTKVPRCSVRKNKYDDNRFVQSTVTCGVFSEGTGVEIHKTKSRRFPYKDEFANETSNMKNISSRPQVNFKPQIKHQPLEDPILIEDETDELSRKNYDHLPIFIPLSSNKLSFSENFNRNNEGNNDNGKRERLPHFASTNRASEKKPLLSLLKLPDQFSASKLLNSGEIGKILVRESGNVEVLIGNLSYTLDAVDRCSFLETVMSLPTKMEAKIDPDIIDLGTISESLVLCPNWDNLFDKKS